MRDDPYSNNGNWRYDQYSSGGKYDWRGSSGGYSGAYGGGYRGSSGAQDGYRGSSGAQDGYSSGYKRSYSSMATPGYDSPGSYGGSYSAGYGGYAGSYAGYAAGYTRDSYADPYRRDSYGSGYGGYGGAVGYGGNYRGYGGSGSYYNNRGSAGFGPSGAYVSHDKISKAGSKLRAVDWKNMKLIELKKDCYKEHASVSGRDQAEIDKYVTENEVLLRGTRIPRPIFHFNESTFPDAIVNQLCSRYQEPTVIQSISWPVALSGRDMISIARTGSGKTLGFILPAIVHVINQVPRSGDDGPIVLVLLPTRELAQQVEAVSKEYCNVMNLALTCCFGGASKGPQASDLKRGVVVCIATPGRLLDFLETGTTNMRRCSYLVLDEADRMLDMGFEPQIRKIVGQIRPDRQTLMFSATWPKDVQALAKDFQFDPVFLNVGSLELSANHNIEQNIEVVDEFNKQSRLFQLLDHIMKQTECKTIIFTDTKRKADELTREMRLLRKPALCIHGDKTQAERDRVLLEFREGKTPILVATDVAARGLDVTDIKFVINYDYPNNSEDYVHRIGRTARRDQKGTAYTFFTPKNAPKARDLIKVLEEAKQIVPEKLLELIGSSSSRFSSRGGRGYSGGGSGEGTKPGYDGGVDPPKRTRYDENAAPGQVSAGFGSAGFEPK